MEPRGNLELLLLAALERVQPAHGYALIAAVRQLSKEAFDLAEGTVYPSLRKLEDRGLVVSEWDSTAPRARRVYRLSAGGVEALASKRAEWRAFRRAIELVAAPPPAAAAG